MACTLGIEQDCNECRMCGNGKGGKKMTNFERIKGMNAKEVAKLLDNYFGQICIAVDNCGCCPFYINGKECSSTKEWLESECDSE